jgi:putative hydrolase of the HAD superfamily
MTKTVFFDLGNVVLFFDHQKMFNQVAAFCGLKSSDLLTHVQGFIDAYERGTIDNREVHHHLCTLSGKSLDYAGLMNALSDIFEPNLNMISTIKELKAKHVPLYILSNTCEAHFNFAYTHYPILHLFDGYVLSYEVNARKPEKEIYTSALHIAGCEPETCFYTDDISEYVEAARTLKFDAETYKTHEQLISQLTERGIL